MLVKERETLLQDAEAIFAPIDMIGWGQPGLIAAIRLDEAPGRTEALPYPQFLANVHPTQKRKSFDVQHHRRLVLWSENSYRSNSHSLLTRFP